MVFHHKEHTLERLDHVVAMIASKECVSHHILGLGCTFSG